MDLYKCFTDYNKYAPIKSKSINKQPGNNQESVNLRDYQSHGVHLNLSGVNQELDAAYSSVISKNPQSNRSMNDGPNPSLKQGKPICQEEYGLDPNYREALKLKVIQNGNCDFCEVSI